MFWGARTWRSRPFPLRLLGCVVRVIRPAVCGLAQLPALGQHRALPTAAAAAGAAGAAGRRRLHGLESLDAVLQRHELSALGLQGSLPEPGGSACCY